jgi:hypothetical protein
VALGQADAQMAHRYVHLQPGHMLKVMQRISSRIPEPAPTPRVVYPEVYPDTEGANHTSGTRAATS